MPRRLFRHASAAFAAVLVLSNAAAAPGAGAPASSAAASFGLTPGGNEPIHIQADGGIEWQQNARVYIARGNAVASRGDSSVHADRLIAHYRQAKNGAAGAASGAAGAIGGTEIYRVEAEGHVVLTRGGQTVTGDRGVYDIDQGIAVVTGRGLKLTTATDSVTARDSLEWYDQKQIAVARGDAVATRGDRTIRADILTAYMVKTAPGAGKREPQPRHRPAIAKASAANGGAEGSKISRVDAQGHVVVSRGNDVGRADFGVYNAETGIATLIGNVVIERGKDVIRGERGVMDLNRNVSRILPGAHQRVQGLFIRDKAEGAPGAAKDRGRPAAPAQTVK